VDESKITTAINSARKGIAQYLEIMALLPHVDVSRDRNFQRKYNTFYRVRQRTKKWYEVYFSYMQNNKASPPSFDSTIDYIFDTLNRCEPSFSSKLVATLDPNSPIWDKFVLKNTDQKPPAYYKVGRIEIAKTVYRNIQRWYEHYLSTNEGQRLIMLFDQEVENHNRVSNLKKVDFVLWQIRA
jgi:hypothetical protein